MKTREWLIFLIGAALLCGGSLMLRQCNLSVDLHLQAQMGHAVVNSNAPSAAVTELLESPELPPPPLIDPDDTGPDSIGPPIVQWVAMPLTNSLPKHSLRQHKTSHSR